MKKYLLVLAAAATTFGFADAALAEWYRIGDGERGPIYMNDESVYIKGDVRSAEVRYEAFGRALFIVNCQNSNYLVKTNQGEDEGYAAPGTVAGVIADEVCQNYSAR